LTATLRRIRRRILGGSLLAAMAGPALAGDLTIPHERYALDNGLDVVLAPDRSTPIVHVQLWYHVGSKDETQGLTGFAHLFEHLMFQGSYNSPGEYFTPLQAVGASINGTTNSDRTNYFETVPAHELPLALFMESDRMGNLLPVLDQAKLDNQREVVRNERRQRYENPPYGEAFADLMAALYPEGHPYHHPTIGSHEDLQNASLDDVKDFFRTWYVPNNATLVVVGDFEPDTAKALIAEQFGWIPAGEQPTPLSADPVVLATSTKEVQADDVPDAKVWVGWHSPAFYAPGDAEMDAVTNLLCSGKDARLTQALVKQQRIARDVGCFQYSRKLGGNFIIQATAAEGHTTDEVVAAIDAELDKLTGDAPPTADEIKAATASFESSFYGRIETISGKAGVLSSYLFFRGEPDWLQADLDRYLTLTPEAVLDAARTVLATERHELHIVPAPEGEAATEGGAE